MRTERGGRKGRRAHSARYYRVYPKTVRRTVVLCRGGPVWPPPPGQPHRVAPTAAPALSGYERVQVGVFLLPPLMHQFSVDTAVACAVRASVLPLASFRAHGARYRVSVAPTRRSLYACRGVTKVVE